MIPYSMNPLGINNELNDLDILRQIRDANPTSQLPRLWLETEDPYTQWEGVGWNSSKTRCISLEVQSKAIKTLQYVNKLTALQTLYCYYNQLTALDVTGLSSLQTLYCGGNQLTALDITGLIGLVELHCTDNQIRTLNATQLTSLQRLECDSNQLTALDVTGLSALQTLYCSYNQLTALDVTGLSALQALYCSYNRLTSMPSVTAKGLIAAYDFINNKFPTSELNRLRALGFTDEAKLLPQNA